MKYLKICFKVSVLAIKSVPGKCNFFLQIFLRNETEREFCWLALKLIQLKFFTAPLPFARSVTKQKNAWEAKQTLQLTQVFVTRKSSPSWSLSAFPPSQETLWLSKQGPLGNTYCPNHLLTKWQPETRSQTTQYYLNKIQRSAEPEEIF